jgi:uncharacterized lipoprotein YmbA
MRRLVDHAVLMLGVSLAGAACGLGPKEDPSQFYVLTAAHDSMTPPSSTASSMILGVGPVLFPDYLKRPQMVTRLDDNEVRLSEVHRWAEDIESGFVRVLALNLQEMTGAELVPVYPWLPTRHIDHAVEVAVLRFERDTTGAVALWAKWIIRNGESREVTLIRESRISQQASGATFGESVAAESAAIATLASEIAAAIP